MKIVFMTSGTINSSLSYRPLSLAKELVKSGHDVYIIAPTFDKYSNFKEERFTQVDGVKIIRPKQVKNVTFEIGLTGYILSSLLILNKIKPDIIHIFKANPITMTGILQKWLGHAQIILDMDDLNAEVMKIENNSGLRVKLVEWSEKIAIKYVDGITAASKYLQSEIARKNKKKLVIHLPNGADFEKIKKINTTKLSEKRIIFVGNLNRTNILEPLMYLAREYKKKKLNYNFVIIGSGKYLNYFKKMTKDFNLEKNIKFLGHVDHNILHKYIKTGDIGYAYMPDEPTIRACSSMKVFEYIQYGATPLVSKVGDFPLYTYNGKAGYIAKANDFNSLVKTMTKALTDKKGREQKINFAKENAPKDYKWETLAKKVNKFYKNIL
jgi:glycosyltransferase involved in cell wall biosynthesis